MDINDEYNILRKLIIIKNFRNLQLKICKNSVQEQDI